ncbi:MAG: nitroreductase family protein [Mycoplasmatales bacterium]|nr:nitroreductase family protein [Mycoplasmatales bacterium]
MTLREIMKFRHTVKKYDPERKIKDEDFHEVLEFIRWAPHSMNFQLVRNIVVDRESKLNKKIANQEAMYSNHLVAKDASKLQFYIVPKNGSIKFDDPIFKEGIKYSAFQKTGRDVSDISENDIEEVLPMFKESFSKNLINMMQEWATRQAYIQLGYATIGASHKGIDTTSMEGINPDVLKEIFISEGLMTENEVVVFSLAYGYRFDDKSFNKSQRKPLNWFTHEVK